MESTPKRDEVKPAELRRHEAEKLAAFKGHWLYLDGLTSLDEATAEKLVAFKGRGISFDGLTSLDSVTEEKLVAFEGDLVCSRTLLGGDLPSR